MVICNCPGGIASHNTVEIKASAASPTYHQFYFCNFYAGKTQLSHLIVFLTAKLSLEINKW